MNWERMEALSFLYDPFSHGTKENVREKQDNKCDKCGKKTKQLQIHHIIPQVFNGKDEERNAVGLDPQCHQRADLEVLELGLDYDGNYLNKLPDERFKGDVNPFKRIDLEALPESWRHDIMMITVGRNTKEKHEEKQKKKKKKKKGKWKVV